jgi:hypothetical protein
MFDFDWLDWVRLLDLFWRGAKAWRRRRGAKRKPLRRR